MPQNAEWKIIHMAHTEKHAKIILDALQNEGFYVRCRRVFKSLSFADNYFEIMVLSTEAVEAQQWLIENNLLL